MEQNLKNQYIELEGFLIQRTSKIVQEWKPAERIYRKRFEANVTNVDNDGNLVIHDAGLDNVLQSMNSLIHENFFEVPQNRHLFKVGDTCLAPFDNDGLYYRGKIVDLYGRKCSVEFVDFGNVNINIRTSHLFHRVVCSEIPQFALRVKLHGSAKNSRGDLDQDLLDKLHAFVVDKQVTVFVDEPVLPNAVTPCSLIVEEFTIATYEQFRSCLKFCTIVD